MAPWTHSVRNWMPVASVFKPITPPSASISRTICPLAKPPIAGLQDIWPIVYEILGQDGHLRSSRAAARAASTPAWPAPLTRTS